MAGDDRLQRLLRRGREDARVHHDERTKPLGSRRRGVGQRRGPVHSDSIFAPRNAKQSSPVQPLERVGCRFGITAPRVHDAALAKVRLQRSWMRLAQFHHRVEHFLLERAKRRALSRMQQLPDPLREKSVGVQVVLFDVQRRVVPLEIARVISAHTMPEDEILRARRRSDGISLHETEPIDGLGKCRGRKQ